MGMHVSETVVGEWEKRIEALEKEAQEIEEGQDGFYKGSWEAAAERAEPEIKKKTIQRCMDDLEEGNDVDDLIEALADWRKEADDLDKRILDSAEWFRSNITRFQLEECIEAMEAALPDDVFEICHRCESKKKPVSDKRYSEGYRWECDDCLFP